MSHNILPNSAPGGKSEAGTDPALVNNSPILAGWIKDTDRTLESLRRWRGHLESWQQHTVTARQFEGIYLGLRAADLTDWAEAVGLDQLRATIINDQPEVLLTWLRETDQTLQALETWLARLQQWQTVARISPEEFEELVVILHTAKLTEWAAVGLEELKEAVMED